MTIDYSLGAKINLDALGPVYKEYEAILKDFVAEGGKVVFPMQDKDGGGVNIGTGIASSSPHAAEGKKAADALLKSLKSVTVVANPNPAAAMKKFNERMDALQKALEPVLKSSKATLTKDDFEKAVAPFHKAHFADKKAASPFRKVRFDLPPAPATTHAGRLGDIPSEANSAIPRQVSNDSSLLDLGNKIKGGVEKYYEEFKNIPLEGLKQNVLDKERAEKNANKPFIPFDAKMPEGPEGRVRLDFGYDPKNQEALAAANQFFNLLDKENIKAERSKNPDLAHCLYIKPQDLTKLDNFCKNELSNSGQFNFAKRKNQYFSAEDELRDMKEFGDKFRKKARYDEKGPKR